jgi:hypothetical protein
MGIEQSVRKMHRSSELLLKTVDLDSTSRLEVDTVHAALGMGTYETKSGIFLIFDDEEK